MRKLVLCMCYFDRSNVFLFVEYGYLLYYVLVFSQRNLFQVFHKFSYRDLATGLFPYSFLLVNQFSRKKRQIVWNGLWILFMINDGEFLFYISPNPHLIKIPSYMWTIVNKSWIYLHTSVVVLFSNSYLDGYCAKDITSGSQSIYRMKYSQEIYAKICFSRDV